MTSEPVTVYMFGANDLPMILVAAAAAAIVATTAAHWVGRRMVRGLGRVRMAAWRRRYNRWAAEQREPVASADLVAVIGKLIAGAR